jgi:hypothetical protein
LLAFTSCANENAVLSEPKTYEVDRSEGGLIPMMSDEPPVSQFKIDAEGNESKELKMMQLSRQSF